MSAGDRRIAAFLDRDGVLNELVSRDGRKVSPRTVREFRLFEEAGPAVRRLRDLGLEVFVVTNQPDIGRGLMEAAELREMHAQLERAIAPREIAVCPHDDADGCHCRKPRPGMLLDLAERHHVDLSRSFMIGDMAKDMEAGRRAGVHSILIDRTGDTSIDADVVVSTLALAVSHIASALSPSGES